MEIKIDTNRDSRDDMKKAIRLLQSLLKDEDVEGESYDSPSEGSFNMFGNSEGNAFEDDEETKEADDDVEIMPYDV